MTPSTQRPLAPKARRPGVVTEIWGYMSHYRKWWLLPIIMVLFVLGIVVATQGSAIAPFIYALF